MVYAGGPLFFGATSQLLDQLEELEPRKAIIFSMRGVPIMDASGLHALEGIWHNQEKQGGLLYFTGLQPQVQSLFERSGLYKAIGEDHFHWSADQAIAHASSHLERIAPTWHPGDPDIVEADALDEMPLGVQTIGRKTLALQSSNSS